MGLEQQNPGSLLRSQVPSLGLSAGSTRELSQARRGAGAWLPDLFIAGVHRPSLYRSGVTFYFFCMFFFCHRLADSLRTFLFRSRRDRSRSAQLVEATKWNFLEWPPRRLLEESQWMLRRQTRLLPH